MSKQTVVFKIIRLAGVIGACLLLNCLPNFDRRTLKADLKFYVVMQEASEEEEDFLQCVRIKRFNCSNSLEAPLF